MLSELSCNLSSCHRQIVGHTGHGVAECGVHSSTGDMETGVESRLGEGVGDRVGDRVGDTQPGLASRVVLRGLVTASPTGVMFGVQAVWRPPAWCTTC